jgi:hypothetical protein
MESKEIANEKLGKYKMLFTVTLLLPVLVMIAYAGYSLQYSPTLERILLNQSGGVYRNEDLTLSIQSEGELKQLTYRFLEEAFTFDYLSLRTDKEHKQVLKGALPSDLPDHREKMYPLFSKGAHKLFFETLLKEKWMYRFWENRKKIEVAVTLPPKKTHALKGIGGLSIDKASKRLNIEYEGHFYVHSRGFRTKDTNYQLTYKLVLERITQFEGEGVDKPYYFAPLVSKNTTDWRVKSITWVARKRQ